MIELSQINIDLSEPMRPSIDVDGECVTKKHRVAAATLQLVAGSVPKLFLEIVGRSETDGLAEVHYIQQTDPAVVVREWLDTLDPDLLEKRVLESADFSGDSTGTAFVRVLKEMADGRT